MLSRGREEGGARLVPETARRGVEHARESECILWIPDEPEVRERVLHLAALVEGDAAYDLVRESERAERVLDRARLRVGPVQNSDVARSVGFPLALQALDLARDELSLMRLVVRLHHHDIGPALPVGPELLLLAGPVVADDRVRRVEDPLRGPIVLFELDDLRVGVVALEVEDVADIGATPAEDGLVVVAYDRQVLLEAREVPKQHVLGAVRVLVLVDEDVLVAVLPFL